MRRLPWILIVLLMLAVLFLWSRRHESLSVPGTDTIEYVETIPFYYPVARDSVVIRYETVKLPIKKDTCTAPTDSVEVEIPITSKEYEDSLYHLWVSGHNVRLDSINVHSRIREIRIPVPAKRKRWGLGLQAGYGYPTGWYVGVGVSWNLWQW